MLLFGLVLLLSGLASIPKGFSFSEFFLKLEIFFDVIELVLVNFSIISRNQSHFWHQISHQKLISTGKTPLFFLPL